VLKICGLIVDMFRMVDGDKFCMGFVYEGMDRCKEVIVSVFDNMEVDYKEIWEVID